MARFRHAPTTGFAPVFRGALIAVTAAFADAEPVARLPAVFNVPDVPPSTAVQVVAAYPGVTFIKPLCFVSPPGDTRRLFVCELGGMVKVIPDVTAANPTSSPVLDLVTAIATPPRDPAETLKPGTNPECGLLGMAFHPDFASNGFFYVTYSVGKADDPAVWYQRLSRFTIPPAEINAPAPAADPSSELILIEQRDRWDNHNGGDIHFGPDGYLYWAVGDERNPNDIYNNSQRIDMNFFGALLRIDVDKKPGNPEPNVHPNPLAEAQGYSPVDGIPRDEIPAGSGNLLARYSIPADNPFVHEDQGGDWDGTFNGSPVDPGALPYVRSEFYAVGLRSPWRFSIDAPTGEIWLGDVGQVLYEEVNLITKGGNYGWAFFDGAHPGPKPVPDGFTAIDPIYEYVHTSMPGDAAFKGNSVIGGVVYRGSRFADLAGAYIFGDYITGHIWALTRSGGEIAVRRIAGQPWLTTFGTDPSNGDVLVSDYEGGRIMRLITVTEDDGFPATLSATGLFTDLAALTPAPGLVAYEPNLSFWSDHAVKRRWFAIPDETARMTWSRDGQWTFPNDQLWVKHFDLEMDRGNPESPKKRIETRLLVKNENGVYGVSYRWNEAGTEAVLAADGGEDFPVEVTVDGMLYTQRWIVPSRSQCINCHSPQAGHALSFNTRQMNREYTIGGLTGNQLDLLHDHGYFANTPEPPNVLPRHLRPDETDHPLEARVRSYLAVNCAYCHAGGSGTAPTGWDGRHEIALDQTGLIHGEVSAAPGEGYKLIVPGDSARSIVLRRMEPSGGFSRMPPLGTGETDSANVELVTDWINQALPNRQSYAGWRLNAFGSESSPEGEPSEDPDGDGCSNHAEFLAGTSPLDGDSSPRADLELAGESVSLHFNVPENRSVQVESSENLTDWSFWDIPGNHGNALPGGDTTFSGPASGSRRFYRLLIRER